MKNAFKLILLIGGLGAIFYMRTAKKLKGLKIDIAKLAKIRISGGNLIINFVLEITNPNKKEGITLNEINLTVSDNKGNSARLVKKDLSTLIPPESVKPFKSSVKMGIGELLNVVSNLLDMFAQGNNFENSLEYIRGLSQFKHVKHWSPYVRYSMYNKNERESIEDYVVDVVKYCREHKNERIVLCMAESAYTEWNSWLSSEMNALPILVKNETYGGSITNAGLMTFDDIVTALWANDMGRVDRILIPSIMLNRAFQDLKKKYMIEFEAEIGTAVTVI